MLHKVVMGFDWLHCNSLFKLKAWKGLQFDSSFTLISHLLLGVPFYAFRSLSSLPSSILCSLFWFGRFDAINTVNIHCGFQLASHKHKHTHTPLGTKMASNCTHCSNFVMRRFSIRWVTCVMNGLANNGLNSDAVWNPKKSPMNNNSIWPLSFVKRGTHHMCNWESNEWWWNRVDQG